MSMETPAGKFENPDQIVEAIRSAEASNRLALFDSAFAELVDAAGSDEEKAELADEATISLLALIKEGVIDSQYAKVYLYEGDLGPRFRLSIWRCDAYFGNQEQAFKKCSSALETGGEQEIAQAMLFLLENPEGKAVIGEALSKATAADDDDRMVMIASARKAAKARLGL